MSFQIHGGIAGRTSLFLTFTDVCRRVFSLGMQYKGLQTNSQPHKLTRQPLSLNNQYKAVGVDSRLATSDPELHNDLRAFPGSMGVWSLRPGHALLRLCEEGQLDEALTVLLSMDQESIAPSMYAYSSLLKACARRKALAQARRVQAHLAKHGLETTRFLGEFVVSTLVKCGGLEAALQLFYRLAHRTVFSWTAIISGHTLAGHGREALRMYTCMRREGVEPDKYTFPSLLKACAAISDLEEGKHIHAEAVKYRCASDVFVGTSLIDMYAKCGCIVDALNVFHGLSQRNVMAWNAMLAGYVQDGQLEKALQLYGKIEEEGVSPNERTFVTAIQACRILAEKEVPGQFSRRDCLETGKEIHGAARGKGYHSKVSVGNALISMYGKCASIVDAQSVFNELMPRDVVSWNAMIAAYTQHGQAQNALQLYEKMWEEGVSPNDRTFVSAILACSILANKDEDVVAVPRFKINPLQKGKLIHEDAQRQGYDSNLFVGNSLISMYGKCGSIVDAWRAFSGLLHPDVVSWNAMLGACVQQGQSETALQLYRRMHEEGISPDIRTFVTALQACGMLGEKEESGVIAEPYTKERALEWGKALHADARKMDFDSHVFVGNTLIRIYGKCGSIVDAHDVFDKLLKRDVVSWNALLKAYAEQGLGEKAFALYKQMQLEGMSPDIWSFVTVTQASAMLADKEDHLFVDGRPTKVKSLERGKTLHANIWKKNFSGDVFVGNTLVSMYGKCGSILDARNVYDELPYRNVVSWNAMLAAYGQEGQADNALELYDQILQEGVSPNDRTYVSIIQACSILAENEYVVDGQSSKQMSLAKGKAIHADAWRRGYELDVFVSSALISMYGKCRSIVDAQNAFDKLPWQSLVAWTAMLTAYVEQGQAEQALYLFEQMQEEGMSPDVWTLVSALQACCKLAEKKGAIVGGQSKDKEVMCLQKVKAICSYAQEKGYDTNICLLSTLICAFGKTGAIMEAQNLFDGFSERDVVLWNAIIAAHVAHGQGDTALQMYTQMLEECVDPNEVTAVSVLQACSNTGSLDVCRRVHHTFHSTQAPLSPLLATTLIHAYGRCGSMVDAQTVFDALPRPDVVSWNSLVSGYARQGNCVSTLQCYDKMGLAGMKPDGVTFLLLLSACSHAGLVDKGIEYFNSMSKDHGINPEKGHYVSMIDLLGRAGHFSKVEHLLSTMPVPADMAMCLCLLGACRKHGNTVLAKQAFDCAMSLDKKHTAAYMLMSNIYADVGLWDSANRVDELRQEAGAWKEPGQSWIEHGKEVHTFMADTSHVGPIFHVL